MQTPVLSSALIVLLSVACVAGAEPVDFEKAIAPVIIRRCLECHNAGDVKGGLNLTRSETLFKGGESGLAIDRTQPAKSNLLARVLDGSMPPEKHPRLTKTEIAAVTAWVKSGAQWPKDRVLSPFEFSSDRRAGLDWWSLQPIRFTALPPVKQPQWVRHPMDSFVLAKLESKNLTPSSEASRRTLIRRLSLIVRGIPPTPEDVRRFAADTRPDAWEQLVDRMLASPHYGERWARHWLDIARFAETNGFETNTPRPNAWRYRDYVIAAFNSDRPYDRFVREQLAGDALGADVGTGFLVAGSYDQVKSPDINLTLMQRQDELHDMVNATSTAFLGLTVACARCHNHKFDPILQQDYYAMQAVFAGVQHGDRSLQLATSEDRKQRLVDTRRELTRLRAELVKLGVRESVNARRNEERFAPIKAKFVRFTVQQTNSAEPCIDELEVWTDEETPRNVAWAKTGAKATSSGNYPSSTKHKLVHINDGKYGNSRSWISNQPGKGWVQIEFAKPAVINRIVWGRDRELQYKDRLAIRYHIDVAETPGQWTTVATSDTRLPFGTSSTNIPADNFTGLNAKSAAKVRQLVNEIQRLSTVINTLSQPVVAYAGQFQQPGPTHRLHRGDPQAKREVIAPAAISSLKPSLTLKGDAPEQQRRLAFANWVANAKNPLSARVMVNRIWQHHFGQGLVATPSDFGKMGVPPSHPELLDWLAAEFIRSGWSVKHIQRIILLSATWRQSSTPRPMALRIDAGSRLLWRFPPRRLEAEAVRDSVLQVAGSLRQQMQGPGFSVFEPNTNYVRNYIPRETWSAMEWRRMIYMTKVRMENDAVFGAFDCPDAGQVTANRSQSTTPLQALNLFNSNFVLQQAGIMADAVKKSAGDDPDAQVRLVFQRAYGRSPSRDEQTAAVQLVKTHGLPALCRAILNSNEFLFVP